MMELTINGQVYQFNFGIGFLRDANKTVSAPVDGVPSVKKDIGARFFLGRLIDGEVDALVDVLDLANKGQNPRVTRQALDAFVDDPDTDIDAIFDMVLDFLGKANATKKMTQKALEMVAEMQEKEKVNQ